MKIGNPSLVYQGKEYVSIEEFARRINEKTSIVNGWIIAGKIHATNINGYSMQYLDWETQKAIYNGFAKTKYMKINGIPEKGMEYSGSIPSIRIPTIPTQSLIDNIIDTSRINAWKYPECWIRDENSGRVVYNPETNEPSIDYDMLKQYLTAQKYQFEIDKNRGMYVDKNELTRSMLSIAKIISSNLESIPQRYGAMIIATVEIITNHTFSDLERNTVANILKGEAENIMNSIKGEIEQLVEEPEESHVATESPVIIPKTKRGRGRPKKNPEQSVAEKRGRGRPRKDRPVEENSIKRKRGRPRKNAE